MPPAKSKALDTDTNLDFLLLVLSKSTEFNPDFRATATAAGITSANNAQKNIKKIVEQGGRYKLEKGMVIAIGDAEDAEVEKDTGAE